MKLYLILPFIFWVFLTLPALANTTVDAPSATALLKALLDSAEANNPEIKASRFQVNASEQDVDAVKWKRWPSASIVTESNTGRSNSTSTSSNSLRVEQTLYDFGKVESQISEFESAKLSTSAQFESKVLDIKLQIVNLWQNLYIFSRKKYIAENQIRQLLNYDKSISNRIEKGAAPMIDRELTTSRLLQAHLERDNLVSNIDNSTVKIRTLTGISPFQGKNASGKMVLDSYEPIFRFKPPQNLADLVSTHPAVIKAENEKKIQDHRIRGMQSGQLPQVYVRMDKPLQSSNAYPNSGPSLFAGVRFSIDGGLSGLSNVQALTSRMLAAEEAAEAARMDVRQALETDIVDLSANRSKISDAQKSIKSAQDVLRSYERQFQAGKKSWQDLLNALREVSQNEYALVEIEAMAVAAMYRIQLRSGQPLKDIQ